MVGDDFLLLSTDLSRVDAVGTDRRGSGGRGQVGWNQGRRERKRQNVFCRVGRDRRSLSVVIGISRTAEVCPAGLGTRLRRVGKGNR